MKNVAFIFVALFWIPVSGFSQLTHFTNPIVAPLHFNPAFAGLTGQQRLTFAYRNELPNYTTRSHLTYVSFDHLSRELNGGIGAEMIQELYRDYSISRASVIYSPKFSFGSNWTFSPAFKFGFQRMAYESTFSPGLNTSYDLSLRRHDLHLSPGVLLNTTAFYIGLSADYLAKVKLRQESNFLSAGGPNLPKLKMQSGYRFQPKDNDKWSLSATALVLLANKRDDIVGYLMYQRRWAMFGGGITRFVYSQYVKETGFSVTAGIKHRRFRLLGEYDRIIERGGAPSFELSFMYYFAAGKGEVTPG